MRRTEAHRRLFGVVFILWLFYTNEFVFGIVVHSMELFEAIDDICEKAQATQEVNSAYYRDLSELDDETMSQLLRVLILDRATELNEIVFEKERNDNDLINRVLTWLRLICYGRCCFNSQERLGFCKPVGPGPTAEERKAIENRVESARDLVAPAIMWVMKEHESDIG